MLSLRIPLACSLYKGTRNIHGKARIGNRQVVGHGINGSYNYKDDAHFPFPAVRFKEETQDIAALRLKEQGDWKHLCKDDKKKLYRASFCQTFAEFQHPTGSWKFILGWALIVISFGFWIQTFFHHYVQSPLPKSLELERQQAQLRRMLDLHVNPIDGISSKWNYDEERWK